MHAMLNIGDSHIMMADAWLGSWEKGPEVWATAGLWFSSRIVIRCTSVRLTSDAR